MGELPVRLGIFLDLDELRLEGSLGRLLHVDVEGGIDPEPGAIQFRPEPGLEQLPNVLDEIIAHSGKVRTRREGQRVGLPGLGRFSGQLPLIAEQVDDQVAALDGVVRVAARVVAGRGLRNGGQHGPFGDVELAGRFAEVAGGRGFDPVGAIAEVDLIQVQLENLVFFVVPFDLERHPGFAEFPGHSQKARPEIRGQLFGPEIPGQLHGDGGEPLKPPAGEQGLERTEDPEPVDPAVVVEAAVLGGQHRGDHGRGDLFQRHDGPTGHSEISH